MAKSIAIDEEGYFVLQDGLRMNDDSLGATWLNSLKVDEFGVTRLQHDGESIVVEPFDKPYVARQVHLENNQLVVQLPHLVRKKVNWESLCLDEWDRFHGRTENDVPFVLSRSAQAELFNLADDFTDDSITLAGKEVPCPDYYQFEDQVNKESFWTQKYLEKSLPNWDLGEVHPELKTTLPQLKINKSRILVLGAGFCHDAAYLAQKGHIVTAVDISETALETAKSRYGHIENLNFVKGDALNLPETFHNSFDLVFEHTFYCAVTPNKRSELIKAWKRYLVDTGHILGIFFVVPKRSGPYFGGSEWELREKLQTQFNFLYWTRLKHSPGWRLGAEVILYAQLKSL